MVRYELHEARGYSTATYKTPKLNPQMVTSLSFFFILSSQTMKHGMMAKAKSMHTAYAEVAR